MGPTRDVRSRRLTAATMTLMLAGALAPVGAAAHPGADHKRPKGDVAAHPLADRSDEHMTGGLVVRVNSPTELAGDLDAVQWAGTPEVADETADLVYAGTGCTPASYAPVADRIGGN
ncbi:MAG: hypothetical protein GEU78_17015, partial [Actinobacteria bacterium]|nr:hypothetical protein [Actinomycetota bacterium]